MALRQSEAMAKAKLLFTLIRPLVQVRLVWTWTKLPIYSLLQSLPDRFGPALFFQRETAAEATQELRALRDRKAMRSLTPRTPLPRYLPVTA